MKFQFSLRALLLAGATVSLVLGLWVRSHLTFQQSISKNWTTSGSWGYNGSHDIFDLTYWLDHRDRPPTSLHCDPRRATYQRVALARTA